MAIDDKLQELLKNKKILIPAIAIGAIAGLYVLSKQSGANGGGGLQPETPLQPSTGDGGGSYDDSGIVGRLTQIEANQQGFASQFMAALQDAISAVRGENASALQSVVNQVNDQLSSLASQNQTVPDFAGFQSQLTAALAAANNIPQQVAQTGNILIPKTARLKPPTLEQMGNRPPLTLSSNPLSSALKGSGTPIVRSSPGYSQAIKNAINQLSVPKATYSGVKSIGYSGTRRGGGSSFRAPTPTRYINLLGSMPLNPNYKPTTVVKKVTGGGGSAFLKK